MESPSGLLRRGREQHDREGDRARKPKKKRTTNLLKLLLTPEKISNSGPSSPEQGDSESRPLPRHRAPTSSSLLSSLGVYVAVYQICGADWTQDEVRKAVKTMRDLRELGIEYAVR
jgi:hypothetical protein